MKYILTSSDSNLRARFNSYDFRNNFDTDYDETNKRFKDVLHLPNGGVTPTVGDYLYFIDNYYEQIPVKVVRLSYGSATCMIWCEHAELWEIDPYIYAAPNAFHAKYTSEFRDTITTAHYRLEKKFPELIKKAKEEYNTENINELGVIAGEIIRYTGIADNTCIDYTNMVYAVCEILSNEYKETYNWHRPEMWEYSDM